MNQHEIQGWIKELEEVHLPDIKRIGLLEKLLTSSKCCKTSSIKQDK